jgi:hypothetical protein
MQNKKGAPGYWEHLFGKYFSLFYCVFNNAVPLRILNNSGILIIKTQQQHSNN